MFERVNFSKKNRTGTKGQMRPRFITASAILFYTIITGPALVQAQEHEKLYSSTAAQLIHDTAYELVGPLSENPETDPNKIRLAVIMLKAALMLDPKAPYAAEDLINTATLDTRTNNTQLMQGLLFNYAPASTNLEPAAAAVRYLLKKANSREQRELLLGEFSNKLGPKKPFLDSELITELGLLKAETADPNLLNYFIYAYEKNKYNSIAFQKITELLSGRIEPGVYLDHLRRSLSVNPYDIQAALAFAEYAERLQLYDDVAVDAWRYCAELFEILYPGQPLQPEIYIPWAISAYNSKRLSHTGLQIAAKVRQSGQFDLIVESLAAKVSLKANKTAAPEQVLADLETNAIGLAAESDKTTRKVTREQMAWFYCFVMPDAAMAVEWANSAYAAKPEPSSESLLAYALMMNNQSDGAIILIDEKELNQISQFTLGMIQLNQNKKAEAIENIKAAIDREPGSLVAEIAKEILIKNQSQYLLPLNSEMAIKMLRNNFSMPVPALLKPENGITAELNLRGGMFPYGGSFGAAVVVTNNFSEPMIISDDSLFTGRIRIDAQVTGDLNIKIPGLVRTRYRPAGPVKPGESILIPVRLNTGLLRKTLDNHPQAVLKIKFTAYLDPVIDQEGNVANRQTFIKPLTAAAERSSTQITQKFLQNKFNSLSRPGPNKYKAAGLFVGLLHEQAAMAGRDPLYKFVYADWMPEMLKSGIVSVLTGDDWIARTGTLAAMTDLTLDYQLINAVAGNINHDYWPVRFMAVYVLANSKNANFGKVLRWTAEKDENPLVRELANALIEN